MCLKWTVLSYMDAKVKQTHWHIYIISTDEGFLTYSDFVSFVSIGCLNID
jgi:hypothetical protein